MVSCKGWPDTETAFSTYPANMQRDVITVRVQTHVGMHMFVWSVVLLGTTSYTTEENDRPVQ